MKQRFVIERKNPQSAQVLANAHRALDEAAQAGDVMAVFDEVKRTLDQNAAMWPALADIAKQVDWPHTVAGQWVIGKMAKEAWKAVLTAAFEGETDMAQGLSGGTVMVGASTSKYGRRKMADFLTFVRAEGNERDVTWSEKAKDTFAEYIDSRRAA